MRTPNLLILIIFGTLGITSAIAQVPVISSLSAASAAVKSEITINGSNFSTTPSNNIVRFGTVTATVKSATATKLVVEVPYGSSYDAITVTVNGLTGASNERFSTRFTTPGTLEFEDYPSLNTAIDRPYAIRADDIDGDGKPDVIAGFPAGIISFFRNQSTVDGALNFGEDAERYDFQAGTATSAMYFTYR